VDNAEAKQLLQVFRNGTADSSDPIFREALTRVESDSALGAWFSQEQDFDALMVAMFREIPPEK